MHRFAWVFVLAPVVVIPAIGFEKPLVPQIEFIQPVFPGQPGNGDANYKPPKGDGPVVELLDEGVESLFPVLVNDGGGEPGTIIREDRDVFAGVEAVRVTPLQKYRSRIPGWDFKIVEKPTKPGEFRYLRFAWKKVGGPGIMIQLHDPVKTWAMRYFAGQNAVGWQPALSVSEKLPAGWELVTRDLFKDHGAFTMTGIALTAMYGERSSALFDHMLLGRTVEDLDQATATALGKAEPKAPLIGKQRDALWDDLVGNDVSKAGSAMRAFLATALDQVEYIRDKLATSAPDQEIRKRIQKLVADLDDDSFDVRDAATDDLIKLGAPAVERLRALASTDASDEVRYRAKLILKKLGGDGLALTASGKMARIIRILERAGGRDARDLLKKMSEGVYGFDGADDAKAALARVPNIWKR